MGEDSPEIVAIALEKTLQRILNTEEVPAVSETSCGNYKDHSLFAAKEYAKIILDNGLSRDPFERVFA